MHDLGTIGRLNEEAVERERQKAKRVLEQTLANFEEGINTPAVELLRNWLTTR